YVSVITDPTTGGVLASFASLGDVIVAEPGALIRFSGERVTSGTVGEKITRAAERALAERRALVIVSASGGARMQEGTIALMQMAKILGALARLDQARLPYLSVITDPTTGGVLASYASLGDIIVAEPGALIRFSGERVTSGTVGEKLPTGFGKAEFLLERGFIDQIVSRPQLRERLAFFLTAFRAASQDLRWSL
ncbi:MAG: carboxyl transferase domain-containing protein, partial [Candidatus Limnocylindria bacterium]